MAWNQSFQTTTKQYVGEKENQYKLWLEIKPQHVCFVLLSGALLPVYLKMLLLRAKLLPFDIACDLRLSEMIMSIHRRRCKNAILNFVSVCRWYLVLPFNGRCEHASRTEVSSRVKVVVTFERRTKYTSTISKNITEYRLSWTEKKASWPS